MESFIWSPQRRKKATAKKGEAWRRERLGGALSMQEVIINTVCIQRGNVFPSLAFPGQGSWEIAVKV